MTLNKRKVKKFSRIRFFGFRTITFFQVLDSTGMQLVPIQMSNHRLCSSWLILLEYNPVAQYLSQEPGLLRGHTGSATMKIDRYQWSFTSFPKFDHDLRIHNLPEIRLRPIQSMLRPLENRPVVQCVGKSIPQGGESTLAVANQLLVDSSCMALFKVWFKTTGLLCLNNLGVTCSSS